MSDAPSIPKLRCRFCGEVNLLPLRRDPDAEMVERVLEAFVVHLLRHGADDKTVARRVRQHDLRRQQRLWRGAQLKFARQHGITEARASQCVSEADVIVARLKRLTSTAQ